MKSLSINLLPAEPVSQKKARARQALAIQISVVVLISTIALAALVFGLQLSQAIQKSNTEKRLKTAQDFVSQLKDQESLVVVLRDRLDGISSLKITGSQGVKNLETILSLLPPSVTITNYTSNKNNEVIISVQANSSANLGNFLDALSDPKKHQGVVLNTKVESLNQNVGGLIRADLIIGLKK